MVKQTEAHSKYPETQKALFAIHAGELVLQLPNPKKVERSGHHSGSNLLSNLAL